MHETEAERELVSLVIGYQMRYARRRRNLSQMDLAKGVVSQSMISLIESGRQFPQPDVLMLIAERLEDPTLASYAQLLSSGARSVMDFAAANDQMLVDVLRAHRGRWHAVHMKIALQLCEHFYHQRRLSDVRTLCELIFDHATVATGQERAYFYYGSTFLFSHDYDNAIQWLRRAYEKQELMDDTLRGRLQYNLGYAYCELDKYGDAVWYAKLAVDSFHRMNDYPRYGKSLALLGVIQARLGSTREARETLKLAGDMLERWGINEADRARIAVSLADVYETQGDYTCAEKWCLTAIDAGSASSDFASVCAAYQTLCLTYLARNETQAAIEAVRSAMSAATATQDGRSMFQAHLLASAILPETRERIQAAEQAYMCAKDAKHFIEQALAADCLSILLEKQDPERAAYYRKVAVHLFRNQLSGHLMSPSAFRYLPTHSFYES